MRAQMGKPLSRKSGTQQAPGRSLNSGPSGCTAGLITMPDNVGVLGCSRLCFLAAVLERDCHESANLDKGGWLLLLSRSLGSQPWVTLAQICRTSRK